MIVNIKLSFRVAAVKRFPTHHRVWKFERAILYALRIETAVSTEVDVFKKETEQRLRNCTARLVDLYRNVSRLSEGDLRLDERNSKQESESANPMMASGRC